MLITILCGTISVVNVNIHFFMCPRSQFVPKPTIGRPKDLNKRHAILESATTLFLELGYEGSSMEKIAKLAGVSKLTVYSHFQDKAHLFTAAIELACAQKLPKTLFDLHDQSDLELVLQQVCQSFLKTLYSPEAMKLTLLMSSLIPHNSELVNMFYHAAPAPTHKNIINLLEKACQFDLIEINNCVQACEFLISILADVNYDRALWQLRPVPTPEQIQIHVQQRLEIFFKIYPLKKSVNN